MIKRDLFSKKKLTTYINEFDRIVSQLIKSKEDINAKWGTILTKDIESSKSKVFHTHNVQSYSAKMLSMILNKKLLDIIELLIGPDIILHHSKLFFKPPLIGAAFPLHQDWSYFPTKRDTMIAAVIHLSKSDEEMGCFRIVPKSHHLGKINNSDGHTYNKKIHQKYQLDDALPIIAKAGDVLFFDARTIHGSLPNNSKEARKTILLQLYSGTDEIMPKSEHTNIQLALRGINHYATRSSVSNIKA